MTVCRRFSTALPMADDSGLMPSSGDVEGRNRVDSEPGELGDGDWPPGGLMFPRAHLGAVYRSAGQIGASSVSVTWSPTSVPVEGS